LSTSPPEEKIKEIAKVEQPNNEPSTGLPQAKDLNEAKVVEKGPRMP